MFCYNCREVTAYEKRSRKEIFHFKTFDDLFAVESESYFLACTCGYEITDPDFDSIAAAREKFSKEGKLI